MTNDLFYCVHTQPIATVDQGVPSNELWDKRLIEVWFTAKIEFGYAPLGYDAAVVGLTAILVQ
jgi:hypothetical protein